MAGNEICRTKYKRKATKERETNFERVGDAD